VNDQKKIQILEAAEHLFYLNGYDQTSMDLIASEAKVSKRTVYNHFATKDILFNSIMQRMLDNLLVTSEIRFDISKSLKTQLTQIAIDEVALLTSKSFLRLAKIVAVQVILKPEFAEFLSSRAVGCERYLEIFLEDACRANTLKIEDIPFASKQFIYYLKSLAFYPKLFGLAELAALDDELVINETVETFLSRYQA